MPGLAGWQQTLPLMLDHCAGTRSRRFRVPQVVVYTSQLPTYADPILDRLDPNRYIAYRHAKSSALLGVHTCCE